MKHDEEWTNQNRKDASLGNVGWTVHHTQISTKEETQNSVNQVAEKAHMSKMRCEHWMEVSSWKTEHWECEVVHEGEHVMLWPNTVQKVEESIKSSNNIAEVALR